MTEDSLDAFISAAFIGGNWSISNYAKSKRLLPHKERLDPDGGFLVLHPPSNRSYTKLLGNLFLQRHLVGIIVAKPENDFQSAEDLSAEFSSEYPALMISDCLPFIYYVSKQPLIYFLDSTEQKSPTAIDSAVAVDYCKQRIAEFAGEPYTRRQPPIRGEPCVCASGWVTTRNGASWHATGECNYCKDRRRLGPTW